MHSLWQSTVWGVLMATRLRLLPVYASTIRYVCLSVAVAAVLAVVYGTPQSVVAAEPESGNAAGRFSGTVVDPTGAPLADAKVYVFSSRTKSNELGTPRATTNADGRFEFDASDMTYQQSGKTLRHEGLIVATKDGFAADWMTTWGSNTSTFREYWTPREEAKIVLQLAKDDIAIRGRFLNAEGQPVAGARVRLTRVMVPGRSGMDGHLEHWSKASVLSGFLTKVPDYKTESTNIELLLNTTPETLTDADGRGEFTGIGRDRFVRMEITSPNTLDENIEVMTRDASNVGMFLDSDGKPTHTVYGANFTLSLKPGLTVKGIVRDRDTKQPIAGMWVTNGGYNPLTAPNQTQGIVETNASGRFVLSGLDPKRLEYEQQHTRRIAAIPQPGVQYLQAGAFFEKDKEVVIEAIRGINYRLKVVDEQGSPVEATVEYRPIHPNPVAWEMMKSSAGVFAWATLNRAAKRDDGTYEGFVLPGPGAVIVSVPGRTYRPAQVDPRPFFAPGKTFEEDSLQEYGTHNGLSLGGSWLNQRDYEAIVLVNPFKDAAPLRLTATLLKDHPRDISLVDTLGQPVEGAMPLMHKIHGPLNRDEVISAVTFPLAGLSVAHDQAITFHHDQRKLVGFLSIRGDSDAPVTVKLQPWAAITGRIVTADGQPVEIDFKRVSGPVITNDQMSGYIFRRSVMENGAFRISGLVPGHSYSCQKVVSKRGRSIEMDVFKGLILEPGEVHDLGDIQLD